jgi:hypothetical protein
MNPEANVTKSNDEAPDESGNGKKPRRKLTDEQRIAEREAEIARIKIKQRERVREAIDAASATLLDCAARATSAGMGDEADRCRRAIEALEANL